MRDLSGPVIGGITDGDSTERGDGETSRAARWGRFAARARRVLGQAAQGATAIAYPPQCIACEAATAEAFSLCVRCWNATPFITRPHCDRLGTPFPADYGDALISPAAIADPPRFDRGRAVALHRDTAKSLVSRLKYGERLDLARPMARLMAGAGREILVDAELLVPVPMHRLRLWRRRYNQAALLAAALSRETGIPVAPDLLTRVRRTRPQVGLSRAERQKNLAGAIRVGAGDAMALKGRRVVVIDDVRTTASTVNACAHILRKAGAARIDVLTFTLVTNGEE
jgi:ComF family protein